LRVVDAGLAAQFFPDLHVYHGLIDSVLTDAQIIRARTYGLGFGALLRKHRFPTSQLAYRVSRPLLGSAFFAAYRTQRIDALAHCTFQLIIT
jgi:hypothetical protein